MTVTQLLIVSGLCWALVIVLVAWLIVRRQPDPVSDCDPTEMGWHPLDQYPAGHAGAVLGWVATGAGPPTVGVRTPTRVVAATPRDRLSVTFREMFVLLARAAGDRTVNMVTISWVHPWRPDWLHIVEWRAGLTTLTAYRVCPIHNMLERAETIDPADGELGWMIGVLEDYRETGSDLDAVVDGWRVDGLEVLDQEMMR